MNGVFMKLSDIFNFGKKKKQTQQDTTVSQPQETQSTTNTYEPKEETTLQSNEVEKKQKANSLTRDISGIDLSQIQIPKDAIRLSSYNDIAKIPDFKERCEKNKMPCIILDYSLDYDMQGEERLVPKNCYGSDIYTNDNNLIKNPSPFKGITLPADFECKIICTDNVNSLEKLFEEQSKLEHGQEILNTKNVENFKEMYGCCYKLRDIPAYDTENAINLNSMFKFCSSLESIPKIKTDKVQDFSYFAIGCTHLTKVEELNLNSAQYIKELFRNCDRLEDCKLLNQQKVIKRVRLEELQDCFSNCNALNEFPIKIKDFNNEQITQLAKQSLNNSIPQGIAIDETKYINHANAQIFCRIYSSTNTTTEILKNLEINIDEISENQAIKNIIDVNDTDNKIIKTINDVEKNIPNIKEKYKKETPEIYTSPMPEENPNLYDNVEDFTSHSSNRNNELFASQAINSANKNNQNDLKEKNDQIINQFTNTQNEDLNLNNNHKNKINGDDDDGSHSKGGLKH